MSALDLRMDMEKRVESPLHFCEHPTSMLLQVNVPERKLVLSEQAASIQEAAERLKVGQVVEGEVTRLVDYGAFVSIIDPESGEMQGANVSIQATLGHMAVSAP